MAKHKVKLGRFCKKKKVRSWESRFHMYDSLPADLSDISREGFWDAEQDEPAEPHLATGEEAGDLLINFLLDMHFLGKLSAKSLCVIAWYSSRAGAAGNIGAYGFRPNAPSGHFQRHLDKCLGVDMKAQRSWRYTVPVPGLHKHDFMRTSHDTLVTVPHESLHGELASDRSILEKVQSMSWPSLYWQHPVVRDSPEPVVPLSLYLDGVPTTKHDGALGFWVYNLVTLKRTLVAVLRKSYSCVCGCGGWCSVFPIWQFIKWSFESMALGFFPTKRHDSSTFNETSDSGRASLSGQSLGYRAILLQIRGDWLELAGSLGFANWMTKSSPCLFCFSTKDSLYDFDGWGPGRPVHRLATHCDYDEACMRCERKVVIDSVKWRRMRALLKYFKGKKGPSGRALQDDFFPANLQRNDRLEPDENLQDVGDYEKIGCFPHTCTFWRGAANTRVKRRCPIFAESLGTSIDNICIDMLHAVYLGPVSDWCSAALWACIDHNFYGVGGGLDFRAITCCQLMKAELWEYYKNFSTTHPNRTLSEVADLTPGMLGAAGKKSAKRALSFKAGETKDILPFCVDLLSKFMPGSDLHCIGLAFVAFLDILRGEQFVVAQDSLDKLHDQLILVLRHWKAAGLSCKPKLHMLMHIVDRIHFQGNPIFYACWEDESINKILADLGRAAHKSVWEARILAYFDLAVSRR